jgi:hypothetical protein
VHIRLYTCFIASVSHSCNAWVNFKGLWPSRSPDVPPPDFFLWGHLKGHVYNTNPHTIEDMKMNISEATASINQRTLHRVAQNMVKRVNACIQENGGYFQHLLWTVFQVLLYCISHILFYYNNITKWNLGCVLKWTPCTYICSTQLICVSFIY